MRPLSPGDRLHLVGLIAACVGGALLLGARPIGHLTGKGDVNSQSLGLRLAGCRDLAIAAALLTTPAEQGEIRAVLARIVTLVQIGDVVIATLMWARGRLGAVPLLGVIVGAAVTEALVATADCC